MVDVRRGDGEESGGGYLGSAAFQLPYAARFDYPGLRIANRLRATCEIRVKELRLKAWKFHVRDKRRARRANRLVLGYVLNETSSQ